MSETERAWPSTARALQVFEEARQTLADLTTEENAFLFESFFKYEESGAMRRLAFEREITKWADQHLRRIEEETQVDSRERRKATETLRRLLESLFEGEKSSLAGKLLRERRALLEKLIEEGESEEQNYRQLRFLRERAKRRFERALEAAESSR